MKDINDRVMFIHIPKTAGASITKALEHRFNWNACNPEKWKPLFHGMPAIRHDPLFLLETRNDLSNFFIFSVTRNPFARAYSLYKHYNTRIEARKFDFETFLSMILDRRGSYSEEHFLSLIPHFQYFMHYTQTFFVKKSNGQIGVDKLYKQENIGELESDFNISLPKINTSMYNSDEYNKAYTTKAIELVQTIYHEDFMNFGYSLEFKLQ